jgi:hypothetical protein
MKHSDLSVYGRVQVAGVTAIHNWWHCSPASELAAGWAYQHQVPQCRFASCYLALPPFTIPEWGMSFSCFIDAAAATFHMQL